MALEELWNPLKLQKHTEEKLRLLHDKGNNSLILLISSHSLGICCSMTKKRTSQQEAVPFMGKGKVR